MNSIAYYGNPWVGMFAKTNNSITIVPVDAQDKMVDIITERLGTSVIKTSIAESNISGLYCVMNSNGMVVPNITTNEEMSFLKNSGLNVYRSKEIQNAHGNNIVVNDKGGLVSDRIEHAEVLKMQDALGVELVQMQIAEYHTIGSCCIATNKGFLTHFKTSEEEFSAIESALKVRGSKGTANMGTGFVTLGVIANDKGYVAGAATSAFELGRIEEALGLIV
ncbi:TPA: translation initiation factor IF-6 [Candidatus Micrarchaeota archaeon]|nr:translation initiation factor IF-6 [Candidatus Micrarchaeota archaeon]